MRGLFEAHIDPILLFLIQINSCVLGRTVLEHFAWSSESVQRGVQFFCDFFNFVKCAELSELRTRSVKDWFGRMYCRDLTGGTPSVGADET